MASIIVAKVEGDRMFINNLVNCNHKVYNIIYAIV
jgi:hypothetical protein